MERKDVSQEPKSTTLEPRNLGGFRGHAKARASSKNFERRTLSLCIKVDLWSYSWAWGWQMVGTRLNISHEEDNCLELMHSVWKQLFSTTPTSTSSSTSTSTTITSVPKRRITEVFLSAEMKYPWCLWWRSRGPFSNIVYYLLDKPRWILYDGRIAETISSDTSGLNWLFLNGVWESKSHPSSRDNDFRRNYFIILLKYLVFPYLVCRGRS